MRGSAVLIKISDIKIKPGRREAKPKSVEEMTRSIQALGLLNPIIVTEDYTLMPACAPPCSTATK